MINEPDGLAKFANQSLHPTFRDYIWNSLIRHDFIERHHIRFKKAKFCDDMICSCDMTPLVNKAVLIPDYTYYYVIRDNSLSNYQYRKEIKNDDILEFIRIYSYLKNKCRELKDKPYYETRCTKGMILMFYAVCGFLKNRSRIVPKLENQVIKAALKHPLPIKEILRFKKYRMINIAFYLLGVIPAFMTISILTTIGKKKGYI